MNKELSIITYLDEDSIQIVVSHVTDVHVLITLCKTSRKLNEMAAQNVSVIKGDINIRHLFTTPESNFKYQRVKSLNRIIIDNTDYLWLEYYGQLLMLELTNDDKVEFYNYTLRHLIKKLFQLNIPTLNIHFYNISTINVLITNILSSFVTSNNMLQRICLSKYPVIDMSVGVCASSRIHMTRKNILSCHTALDEDDMLLIISKLERKTDYGLEVNKFLLSHYGCTLTLCFRSCTRCTTLILSCDPTDVFEGMKFENLLTHIRPRTLHLKSKKMLRMLCHVHPNVQNVVINQAECLKSTSVEMHFPNATYSVVTLSK